MGQAQLLLNLPTATATGHAVEYSQWVGGAINTNEFTGYTVEEQTASAGQTAFTLATAYTVGVGALRIYIRGVYQAPSGYTETSTTVVTFSAGLDVGDKVAFVISSFDAASTINASAVSCGIAS